MDAIPHGEHLGLSKSFFDRMNLTIDVRLCQMIKIDQRQLPDAAACECLGSPGAHATDADNHYMR